MLILLNLVSLKNGYGDNIVVTWRKTFVISEFFNSWWSYWHLDLVLAGEISSHDGEHVCQVISKSFDPW